MTVDEVKKVIDELKAQGWSEEDILGSFYTMFQNDEINFDELEALTNVLGYEITDEFRNMSPEDQKTKGYEETDEPAEGVDKEEIEDAKEYDKVEDNKKTDSDDKKTDEDDEETQARKLFGMDK